MKQIQLSDLDAAKERFAEYERDEAELRNAFVALYERHRRFNRVRRILDMKLGDVLAKLNPFSWFHTDTGD